MNVKAVFIALGIVIITCRADAQQPTLIFPPVEESVFNPGMPSLISLFNDLQDKQGKDQKPDKGKQPDPLPQPQPNPLFDDLGSNQNNGESTAGYNPHMMGDFPLKYALRLIGVTGLQTTTVTYVPNFAAAGSTSTSTCTVCTTRAAYVPVATTGCFNVAENESPRPQDRVFGFYDYFGNLHGPQFGPGGPLTTSQSTTATVPSGTITTSSVTTIPGVARPSVDLNREVIGFEKTFFDGRASIEVRLPFLQAVGVGGDYSSSTFGDVTLVGKYALLLDNTTGNVFSVGLALTLPTGGGIDTVDGTFRDTLFQPFFGYIVNFDNFFIQGIHSIVIPTDAQDVTLMFNDVAIDYWLYRGSASQFISAVVPTLEAHLTTPLNHRNGDYNDPFYIPDVLVLTSGMHFGLYGNTTVTLGAAVPVTNPFIFSIEGFVQLNWRF